MPAFHIAIHARPAAIQPGDPVSLGGLALPTWRVPRDRQSEPWPITFEFASAALRALPRMFVEPDGALLWVAPSGAAPRWQLDGNLWDRRGRLIAVELRGQCPASAWDELLRQLASPPEALLVRLVREAIFLPTADFRRWAFA